MDNDAKKFSVKLFVAALAVVLLALVTFKPVEKQQKEQRSLTEEELASLPSFEEYVRSFEPDTNYIMFYYDGLFDHNDTSYFYYDINDSMILVRYDDPDVFDYDYLQELAGDSIYVDYVGLLVNRKDAQELFDECFASINEKAEWENHWRWTIKEITIPDSTTVHFEYYLEKGSPYVDELQEPIQDSAVARVTDTNGTPRL